VDLRSFAFRWSVVDWGAILVLVVPEAFAKTISDWQGEPGREWLEGLPALFERLCGEWGLTPEGPVMHGAQGIVVPVSGKDEPCVLKIGWLSVATKDEERALRAWNGRGAVRVLESQPEVGAMLIERLDSNHSLESVPIREAVEIISKLLRRLAIEPLP
jgi:streptomycin 6-kinase